MEVEFKPGVGGGYCPPVFETETTVYLMVSTFFVNMVNLVKINVFIEFWNY